MSKPFKLRTPPADCGKRLLPVVIDQLARDEPTRAWCSLPRDDYDLAAGYEDVTYAEFANAINKISWFITAELGKCASGAFDTIAYLGVPDIRYHIMQMAACKTGYKVLFSSQLNSIDVHTYLMEETDCTAVLSAIGVRVDDVLAARPGMKHAVIPELDDLLDMEDIADPFSFEKTFDEARWDPFMVLHSSGTTGLPKALAVNHAVIASQDAQELLPPVVRGRSRFLTPTKPGEGVRVLMTAAPFHAMSACYAMIFTVFRKAVLLPGFRHRSVNPSDLFEILEHSKPEEALMTPWLMEDVARAPDAKDYIEQFDAVSFAAAVLSPHTARVWSKYTRIHNLWGTTEAMSACYLETFESETDAHDYVFFDVDNGGYDFRKIKVSGYTAEDGTEEALYELVLTLTEKSALVASWHAGRCMTLENTKPPRPEWESGDLWTPHPDPSKAEIAWKYVCRKDDLISFSTGINAHPAQIQRALAAHDDVRAAIVVGDGRRQALVLAEAADGSLADQAMAGRIWEEALAPINGKQPAHMRIARTHFVLVPPRSFVWTAKGTVAKQQTAAKFAALIDETYDRFGDRWSERRARERYGSITATTNIEVQFTTNEGKGGQ